MKDNYFRHCKQFSGSNFGEVVLHDYTLIYVKFHTPPVTYFQLYSCSNYVLCNSLIYTGLIVCRFTCYACIVKKTVLSLLGTLSLLFCWISLLTYDFAHLLWQGHQYETVSGFVCEAFGYIPRTGESIKVVLEKDSQEEDNEYKETDSERRETKKSQIFKLEVC